MLDVPMRFRQVGYMRALLRLQSKLERTLKTHYGL